MGGAFIHGPLVNLGTFVQNAVSDGIDEVWNNEGELRLKALEMGTCAPATRSKVDIRQIILSTSHNFPLPTIPEGLSS